MMNIHDFTFDHYQRLLDTALNREYTFYTVKDYITTDTHDTPCIVIRHDVDRHVDTARQMAREEDERDIQTTYYYRTSTFSPQVAHEAEFLGHEVGYHYEDLVKSRGDFEVAHIRFERNLERFRKYADVRTICPHESPLSSVHNLNMWNDNRTLEEYDLDGDAYLSIDTVNDDPEKASYAADTGRIWRSRIAGFGLVVTTDDLIEALRTGDCERYYLLVHPGRWSRTRGEHIQRLSWDIGAETAKAAMRATRLR